MSNSVPQLGSESLCFTVNEMIFVAYPGVGLIGVPSNDVEPALLGDFDVGEPLGGVR